MKRFVIAALLCLTAAGWVSAQKKGDTMYVNIKSPLKTSTGFFAGTVTTLNVGQQVRVLDIKDNWIQVSSTSPSATGWIAKNSLTTKRPTAGNSNTVSSGEMAMAGKGFSQEVENQYKKDHELNYTAVDAMEKRVVTERELLSFVEEGHLNKGE